MFFGCCPVSCAGLGHGQRLQCRSTSHPVQSIPLTALPRVCTEADQATKKFDPTEGQGRMTNTDLTNHMAKETVKALGEVNKDDATLH